MRTRTAVERFWMKIVRSQSGCWEWTATLYHGYGKLWVGGKWVAAHRYSYELLVEPIPVGLDIDHLCRNRRCVNPSHLEPVTERENNLRGESFAAKNALKTHCPQGHPYEGDNLYVVRGSRYCRECSRTASREYQRRRRGKVA